MNEETDSGWKVAWSWKADERIARLCHLGDSVAVASGQEVILINSDGYPAWRTKLPFLTFNICFAEDTLGVLAGHGFHVLRQSDGTQLHEGRATSGGFSDILSRPGGGWVLSDRKEHLHLFNTEGRGIRRLKSGRIRKLLGWFDREHLLVHDEEGYIRCIRMIGDDSQRVVEERIWSWCSRLEEGQLLMQALDGEIWEGVPHPFGWDMIRRIETLSLEPIEGVIASDGWWLLSLSGELERLPPVEDNKVRQGGDLLVSDSVSVLVSASREGLLKWWEAPDLALLRRRRIQSEVAQAREELDWDNRKKVFVAARNAEDNGQLSRAAELYQKLGRTDDVRRILKMKREEG